MGQSGTGMKQYYEKKYCHQQQGVRTTHDLVEEHGKMRRRERETKCEFVPLGSIRHNKSIFPALCNKQSIYFRYYSIVLSLDTVEILPTEDFQITKQ